jgi:hypothetical protein
MIITPKQAGWGHAIIALAAVIFIGYWIYLLVPLQAKLIEAHKVPNLVLTIIRSVIVASICSFLTFLGLSLAGYAWQKWSTYEDLKLGDALESKAFWLWLAIWNVGVLLFSLLWKYDNF